MFSVFSYSGKQETWVLSSVWVKRVLRTSLVVAKIPHSNAGAQF